MAYDRTCEECGSKIDKEEEHRYFDRFFCSMKCMMAYVRGVK